MGSKSAHVRCDALARSSMLSRSKHLSRHRHTETFEFDQHGPGTSPRDWAIGQLRHTKQDTKNISSDGLAQAECLGLCTSAHTKSDTGGQLRASLSLVTQHHRPS